MKLPQTLTPLPLKLVGEPPPSLDNPASLTVGSNRLPQRGGALVAVSHLPFIPALRYNPPPPPPAAPSPPRRPPIPRSATFIATVQILVTDGYAIFQSPDREEI
ncbi:hypothetical protein PR202_ga14517 [Eleusine coracana subsp. coracana]|uniref:Uncharacterized protein n=1 Tax=Eleusine coracana subsp. coracana TaxID=191504 RepID=A0AAV5CHU1_ELECO|nr:hypothetical protein PR202_ga14517 [Eleusine coracana subsp. coracana]